MDRREQLLLAAATDATIILMVLMNKRRAKRGGKSRIWVRDWINRRLEGKGLLTMLNDELLIEDPSSYKNFLRMNNSSFKKLLNQVKLQLTKQDTVMRASIPARSKLETTLRFLATGECYRSLMYSTRIDKTTISRFVPIVCEVIYTCLKGEYLKTPADKYTWTKLAQQFEDAWHFPHCLGALDGRHINFRPPVFAESYYYNYKGYHSIILLGMADGAYKFIYYNVGVNGRISDGGVFRESELSKAIANNSLNFPESCELPGQTVKTPYVIVADDAFPLSTRIMKPFLNRGLTHEQKVFNYRLSRTRRMIESTFGILANRFRVFMNPIQLAPEKMETITLACIALHNFLANENWKSYTEINEDFDRNQLQRIEQQGGNRSTVCALQVRENFKHYFNSEFGAVSWQNTAVQRNNM